MNIERIAMDKLLMDELASYEEAEGWRFDRVPEMPLLGFLAGSVLSLGIWLAGAWVALTLIG